jgi:hypothetical protein
MYKYRSKDTLIYSAISKTSSAPLFDKEAYPSKRDVYGLLTASEEVWKAVVADCGLRALPYLWGPLLDGEIPTDTEFNHNWVSQIYVANADIFLLNNDDERLFFKEIASKVCYQYREYKQVESYICEHTTEEKLFL